MSNTTQTKTPSLATPKSRRNVVAENKASAAAAVAATNAKKPTQTQSKPGFVPGHPTTKLYTGKGATGSHIAALASANKGHDTVAITNDGGTYPVTKYLGAGIKVKVGMSFPELTAAYTKAISAEGAKRAAQPKGPAVLAKGAETEVHSRKAAQDSKGKPASTAKAEKAKAAPKGGKNKAPSAGVDYDYKVGKKAIEAKPDSWRHYMLTTIRAHGNTAAAKAAHAKGKKFTGNKLDFSWSLRQGYIVR